MSIRLYDSNLEKKGLHIYVFILEKFTSLRSEIYSKPFHCDGHRWKLQAGIKEKYYFGVFLRWLGGGELTNGVKCKMQFTLGILNRREPSKSIRRGDLDGKADEFTISGCGIGWGKLATLDQLTKDRGFIIDDSVLVELQCRKTETTFEQKLACDLNPGETFVKSSMFSICNARWSIILFPQGLPVYSSGGDSIHENPQSDDVAVYLLREDTTLLRYKISFSFHVRSKLAKTREIMYNFYETRENACNDVFGVENFIPMKEMKKISKSGKVKIKVKIKLMEPYFYLALSPEKIRNNHGDTCTREDLVDQCNNSLCLTLAASQNEKVVFTLTYDPQGENKTIDETPYFKKIFWRIILNSLENDSETVVVSSSDEPGRSSFCYSKAMNSIISSLDIQKILEKNSVYLDDEGFLSVHMLIMDANLLYDPLLNPLTKHSVSKLKEEKEHGLRSLERERESFIDEKLTEKDEIISEQKELLEKTNSIIEAHETINDDLKNEREKNVEYSIDLGHSKSDEHLEQSLQQLTRNAKPSKEDLKAQKDIQKKITKFLKKKLPFNISRVSAIDAYGQNTTLKGIRQCNLAIAIQDLPSTEHESWLPSIIETIKTLLEQKDENETTLPLCNDFTTTSTAVHFKCDEVIVSLAPINDWEEKGGVQALYQMSMKQDSSVQIYYQNNVCELQAKFISTQSDKCKDLIRVVKKWSYDTEWKDGCRPGDYLLALLVVQSYEIIQPDMCEPSSTDLDIFIEMAELVDDVNLELSWDTSNYTSAQYPPKYFPKPFLHPIIQDPAIPTHNVAETNMGDWNEFRSKFKDWVLSLSR